MCFFCIAITIVQHSTGQAEKITENEQFRESEKASGFLLVGPFMLGARMGGNAGVTVWI